MKRRAPPLRFLALAVGGWVCARAALLAPDLWVEQGAAAPASARRHVAVAASAAAPTAPIAAFVPAASTAAPASASLAPATRTGLSPRPSSEGRPPLSLVAAHAALPPTAAPPLVLRPFPAPARPSTPNRLSASAWLLVRNSAGGALAPGGTLGGSQAGMRLRWRLNGDAARPLALSARLYSPLGRPSGAEGALGLDWRPLAEVPVHILAERRQALGRDGRSAFALALHGGVAVDRLPAGFRLDAYGQAGIVGLRRRDPFADAAARLSIAAADGVEIGAGLWGGAQPGAARLDAGPQVSLRLPLAGERLRLSAEWRFRLAGDAHPGSGPALSLGSDF